jgi:hypothetical protein
MTYIRFLGLSELSAPPLTHSRRSSNMLWIALNTSAVWIRSGEESLLYWDWGLFSGEAE